MEPDFRRVAAIDNQFRLVRHNRLETAPPRLLYNTDLELVALQFCKEEGESGNGNGERCSER